MPSQLRHFAVGHRRRHAGPFTLGRVRRPVALTVAVDAALALVIIERLADGLGALGCDIIAGEAVHKGRLPTRKLGQGCRAIAVVENNI